jgi:hypothetical protein
MSSRRDVLTALGIASAAALAAKSAFAQPGPTQAATQPSPAGATNAFWPNGARIAVSASLMLEAGGQNLYRSDALFGPMPDGYLDLPTNSWFEYGAVEGIPRLLICSTSTGSRRPHSWSEPQSKSTPTSRARSCGAVMKPPRMAEPGRAHSHCRETTKRKTSQTAPRS